MAIFEKALEGNVMSTHILIRADVKKDILLKAYQISKDFEDRYSAYKENSLISTINKNSGLKATKILDEDIEIFNKSIQASKDTNGLFDITIGSLSHGVYHFGFKNQKIASKQDIKKAKSLISFKNIELKNNSIFLKQKNMRIDLGGIGKGYVSKLIAKFLLDNGAKKMLVDVGGEIISMGKSYVIAIKNPFKEGIIATIKTSKEPISISTSGDYERFIDRDNHHIIDTKEGKSNLYYSSMTIIKNSLDIDLLDAYATALFNQQNIKPLINRLDISAIVIDRDKTISLHNIDKLKLDKIEF